MNRVFISGASLERRLYTTTQARIGFRSERESKAICKFSKKGKEKK
jgi:hypothetical protein